METNRTVGWQKCYDGYSTMNVLKCDDGDLVIEVERCYEEGIFDSESFDVAVEFENGGVKEPLIYVHEGQTELNPEEQDMVNTIVREYLKEKSVSVI